MENEKTDPKEHGEEEALLESIELRSLTEIGNPDMGQLDAVELPSYAGQYIEKKRCQKQ